jgi:hypothetical protein
VYDDIGGFDPELNISMDYDWLLRCREAGIQGHYGPNLIGAMRDGGVSNTHKYALAAEVFKINRRHGASTIKNLAAIIRQGIKHYYRKLIAKPLSLPPYNIG